MPFGEYSPVGFGWFTRSLKLPLKDMSAGAENQAPMTVMKATSTLHIGILICQEDAIGRDARQWAESATMLLNPSNLAWFENSLAIEQRLQVVRMRSLEIARPILRVANTGITAQIDAHGQIVARLPSQEESVLSGWVQGTQGLTLYARAGDGLALALCVCGMAPALRQITGRHRWRPVMT